MSENQDIDLLKALELQSFHYSNPAGVAVVMPCIDTEKGMNAAKILSRRAGMPCKILIVHDTGRQGFIKTINDAVLRLNTRYIVYLAEDAYPGLDWLRSAWDTLENSGKGLLAFNDGKWKGQIASFGMVRTKWVNSLYGGLIFSPEYKNHQADIELTVIARAQNMFVYDPESTLLEYDPDKDFGGPHNPEDKAIFQSRFRGGFNGLVPFKKLENLAKEYDVTSNPPGNKTGISIIINVGKGAASLDRLLSSFIKVNTYSPVELIVIDNSSTGGAEGIIDKYAADCSIRFLKLNGNESFAVSNSLAVKEATSPYLLFLNTDIIYTNDVLSLAAAQLQEPDIGVVGIRLDDYPQDLPSGHPPGVQHLGIKFEHDTAGNFYRPFQLRLKTVAEAAKVPSGIYPAVSGAFLLCRKADFEKLGGFCGEYDQGFEDIDFCLRIKKKFNKVCLCLNEISQLRGFSPVTSKKSSAEAYEHDICLLNKKFNAQIIKNRSDDENLKHFNISEERQEDIKVYTTNKSQATQKEENLFRISKWESLVADHALINFRPPDLHDMQPIGWVQPHLNCCGGIRRVIEMSNRLSDWGAEFYLITPQGTKTDWLPIKANVIAFNDAIKKEFGTIIVSDPDCIDMFDSIPKKNGLFYHLAPYMLYRKKNDAFYFYYNLCKNFTNVGNSQWTATHVENFCGIKPQGIFSGGINKEQFKPYIVNKEYDICFFGSKSRKLKGTKELNEALKGLAQLPLADCNLSQDMLAPAICSSRVFVSGSYYEGFNFCPLEAMACGIPVVMTDCGGSREYAVNEGNALVVPNRDYRALREQVDRLLHDNSLRLRLIENGLETAWEFDWDRITASIGDLFLSSFVEKIDKDKDSAEIKTEQKKSFIHDTVSIVDNKLGRIITKKNSSKKKEKNNQKWKNERQVKLLRFKLLNLGITKRAFADLKKLVGDDSEPHMQRLAAWELALWHADKYNREDARQCLELLPIATQGENDPERSHRVAILKAECHDILGDLEAGEKTIQQAMSAGPNADLYLAAAHLESSISGRIEYINKALELDGISKITFNPIANRPPYDCLRPVPETRKRPQRTWDSFKVTVIVPAYNAEKSIPTALDSILAQTWANLEVLVVDDCSTDGTVEVVKEYEINDPRVRLIKGTTNQGPYVARNLALRAATGEFVTCNDADDWSHPEKIEIQANHLIQNVNFLANVSRWARATNDLKFYRRGNPGFYVQLNISSLMFRREPLMNALGFWDSVRFGADTELFNRIKRVFGNDVIEENRPGILSFARSTEYSLTENEKFGYPGFSMGARREYTESYLNYHSSSDNLLYEFPPKSRLFPVPEVMNPSRKDNSFSNRHFEIVLVSDFRQPDNAISTTEEIKAQKRKGLRIGLVQMARYDLDPKNNNIDQKIRELIDGDHIQMLVFGEEITCDMLIIRDPSILQEKQRYIPGVKTENVSVVVEKVPEKDSGSGGFAYDIRRCAKHLYEYFGKSGVWHPIDAQVRQGLYKLHGDDLKSITMANEDWSNNIGEKKFLKTSRPQSGYKITNQSSDMLNDNEGIKLVDVKDLDSFTYTDAKGVAVIMPCINTKKGMDTAGILFKRAGIDCKIFIIHDTLRQGFIKILNDTASRVSTRYIVYLAEDAFPSIDWLRCAYDALEKSCKGLLAFNDGKWRGRIAAFGMVRVDWVKSLYGGGLIFYPEYNTHKADNELTVIARTHNMLEYNPECTLIECDPNKVFKENVPKDKELFRKRFLQGFDGLVPLENLAPLAKEYFVPWKVIQTKPDPSTENSKNKQDNNSNSGAFRNNGKSDLDALKKEYRKKGLDKVSDTFVLYRIIGNDLHPRHKKGQSRENLCFILENEPDFEDCEKKFIINRIIDQNEEQAIIKLLKDHKREHIQIRFDPGEYRKIGFDTDCFPEPGYLSSNKFEAFDNIKKERATVAIYRLKNNYVMNNNGARNAALRDGRERAKWVLPWDGNCFITTKAWERILVDVTVSPYLKYFVVPMARVLDNKQLLSKGFTPEPVEEPQIIFRSDAKEEFDEVFCYGRRPKVELFWRLGVPGKWDHWPKDDSWDQKRLPESIEARQFGVAGWVARLFSGMKDLELENKQSITKRVIARNEAIISTLHYVDTMVAGMSNDNPTSFWSDILEAECLKYKADDDPALSNVVGRLISDAEDALTRGPYSVTDKTTLPPSGNVNDYWHPAPYWWPNPDMLDGLPYIRKDGERAPGTRMYEPESEKYDRTRLQRVFDDSITLALAWKFSGEKKYVEHSAGILDRFFVNSATQMTPHLKYGQVKMGHNKNKGSSTGVIEMKDMYFYLDAVRMMTSAGVVSNDTLGSFKDWLKTYLDWLLDCPQGKGECRAINNHGTCYDLQVASIASFLDEKSVLFETLARAQSRISQQFAPDGSQPDELKRKTTAHYCFFNFQSWLNLAEIASLWNVDFWTYEASNGASLVKGARWLMSHMGKEWPYQQIDEFNIERFYPIWFVVSARTMDLPEVRRCPDSKYKVKPKFFPHDGIRPFWNLGIH